MVQHIVLQVLVRTSGFVSPFWPLGWPILKHILHKKKLNFWLASIQFSEGISMFHLVLPFLFVFPCFYLPLLLNP